MRLLFFVILAAGIGNTVLRPEIENPYTLYRLLAPLGLLAVFIAAPKRVIWLSGIFAFFVVYNVLLAGSYSADFSQLLPSLVHYLYLFILLVLMIHLRSRRPDFDRSYLRFLQHFFVFLLANLALEAVIGPYYPNLYVDESEEPSLRAFFWNQNDLAVVLCVITWIALALDRFRGSTRVFVLAITIALLFYNDSKAALLSLLLTTLPAHLVIRICATTRIAPSVWFGLFAILFGLGLMTLVAVSDVGIAFANETYSIGDLLVQPIVSIVSLQASGEEWGSLNNRTDAAVFVILEYLRTFGVGLGAGGSWLVLTLPQYQLGGAQSPHNALLQFIVDFGYPVLLGYAYLLVWAIRRLFRHRLPEHERLKVMAILSFPMLGLSQSGAIVTNYFFFACVYWIWMLGPRVAPSGSPAPNPAAAPPRGVVPAGGAAAAAGPLPAAA